MDKNRNYEVDLLERNAVSHATKVSNFTKSFEQLRANWPSSKDIAEYLPHQAYRLQLSHKAEISLSHYLWPK
jgi:hypothetical protein